MAKKTNPKWDAQQQFKQYKYTKKTAGSPKKWSDAAKHMSRTIKSARIKEMLLALCLERTPKTLSELSKARRRAIFDAHPDRGGSRRRALRINEAYLFLKTLIERRTKMKITLHYKTSKKIQEVALAAYKQLGINPIEVVTNMQLFPGNFFENTPRGYRYKYCSYMRYPGTHSAIAYNPKKKKVVLVKPEEYWTHPECNVLKQAKKGAKQGFKQFQKGVKSFEKDYREGKG